MAVASSRNAGSPVSRRRVVSRVTAGADDATITLENGTTENFGVVFGADGDRSLVHAVMYPIPDFDEPPIPGNRRINRATYTPQLDGLVVEGKIALSRSAYRPHSGRRDRAHVVVGCHMHVSEPDVSSRWRPRALDRFRAFVDR